MELYEVPSFNGSPHTLHVVLSKPTCPLEEQPLHIQCPSTQSLPPSGFLGRPQESHFFFSAILDIPPSRLYIVRVEIFYYPDPLRFSLTYSNKLLKFKQQLN
jgi:hypothetical protein